MLARVKPDARWHSVTACAGIQFVKDRWLPVPAEREEEAINNPYLEVQFDEVEPNRPEDSQIQISKTDFENTGTVDQPPKDDEGEGEIASSSVPNASVAAMKYADKAGIDLANVEGTGKDGQITIRDVKTYQPTE